MFIGLIYFLTIILVLLVIGGITQPTIFRRLLFINSLTNVITLLLVVLGNYQYRESYIDIALTYCLVSFVAMYGILAYCNSSQAKKTPKNLND